MRRITSYNVCYTKLLREVRKLPMAYAGRFIAENEGKDGFCKVIVGKKYKEILGVHLVGGACSYNFV